MSLFLANETPKERQCKVYDVSYCIYAVDLYNMFPDAVSVVECCQSATDSLFSRHDIRTEDSRLPQPEAQKHSRDHGIRHEGFSLFFKVVE